MGVLQNKVKEAFGKYRAGDFEGFVKDLVDVGDVRWGWHRGIVDGEVERQLNKVRTWHK